MKKRNQLVKASAHDLAEARALEIEKIVAEQKELMTTINARCVAAGRKPQFDDMETTARLYKIVPIEGGGYKISRRQEPLVCQFDNSIYAGTIARSSKTLGERFGRCKPGKYNDGAMLLNQQAEVYSVGEVSDFLSHS